VTLLFGAVVILANILTDVLRGLLDPKVSYE
jgi:ABC-type dipeptide/oligopeptide/nickel transport system permease component